MRVDDGRIFDVAGAAEPSRPITADAAPPTSVETPPHEPAPNGFGDGQTVPVVEDVERQNEQAEVAPTATERTATQTPVTETAVTDTTPVVKKRRGRLRRRYVVLAVGCLAIGGIAAGIAVILGGGGSPPEAQPQPATATPASCSAGGGSRTCPLSNSSQPTWGPGTMIAFTVGAASGPTVHVGNVGALV